MQKKQDVAFRVSRKRKKHPISQRLVAGLLCICLCLMSLSIDGYDSLAAAVQGREITVFLALPKETSVQEVKLGVPKEGLDLPDTLSVVCQAAGAGTPGEIGMAGGSYTGSLNEGAVQETAESPIQEAGSQIESSSPQEGMEPFEALPEETGSLSEPVNPEEPGEPIEPVNPEEPGEPTEPVNPEEPGNSSQLDPAESITMPGQGQTETVTLEDITWFSEPEYDSGTEGTYTFTPALPAGYTLAEGTDLPKILVTVEGDEESGGWQGENTGKEVGKEPGEKEIQVQEEELEAGLKGRAVQAAPGCGVISRNTVWNQEGTLADGELIVEQGVTLTLSRKVTVNGDVTVKGGGTINRNDNLAYISVEDGKTLILEDITLDDSNRVVSENSFVTISPGGKLVLNSGSIIQNCKAANYGGAIYNNNGKVEMNEGSIIQNCNSENGSGDGGAIYNYSGTVEMGEGSIIQNCKTTLNRLVSKGGGAIHNSGTLKMGKGSIIQNCESMGQYGGGGGGAIYNYGTVEMNEESKILDCHATEAGAIFNWGTVQMNPGSTIQDCIATEVGGAIMCGGKSKVFLNDARIENCTAGKIGGGIYLYGGNIIINNGTYKNNKTTLSGEDLWYGGGFIYNLGGTLTINGGDFIGNTTITKGSCILHREEEGTTTYLNGGNFQGNQCTNGKYKGSGALYYAVSEKETNAPVIVSSDVQFCGDGDLGSGTDGIYLDSNETVRRKILVSSALTYPVPLYLEAQEGYVLAEGTSGYRLQMQDLEMVKFVDVGTSGQEWYAVLEKVENQIYLSSTKPDYGYSVNYYSNGAQGSVIDGNSYQAGDVAQVKSAEGLAYEGHNFKEWNTKADGSGDGYQPGNELEITGDVDLFAIFREKKTLSANFYSGGAGQKEIQTVDATGPGESGTVAAMQLQPMEGWEPVGWDVSKDSYLGDIKAGTELTLTEDKDYYGVYEKEVILSYIAEGVPEAELPGDAKGKSYANVHEEVARKPAEFRAAQAVPRPGYIFEGWTTKADGSGELYLAGESLESGEDLTLYAKFRSTPKKTLTASFYSGKAGQKEDKSVEIEQTESAGRLAAPQLKPMEGWESVGWDSVPSSYVGDIKAGAEITLTEDQDYYGVYKKDITLSYTLAEQSSVRLPAPQKSPSYANVHMQVTQLAAEFTVAAGPKRDGYAFKEWNTKADGTGNSYQGGDTLESGKDITLYAIYGRTLSAVFYSGSAGYKEMKSVSLVDGATSGRVTAPQLKPMEGWESVGWDSSPSSYQGGIEAGEELTLTEDTSFYGIYKKGVTLSYQAKGVEGIPQGETADCCLNVHEETSVAQARFSVSAAPKRPGCAFTGWNTRPDGTGETYQEGQFIETETDVTLYAVYQKTLTADFYSGGAGRKESKSVSIGADAASGNIKVPELAVMEGWEPVGWELSEDSYDGETLAGAEVTLERDTSYYGVYRKSVAVSYDCRGVIKDPEGEEKVCRANVHQEASYAMPGFTLAKAPAMPGYQFKGWNTEADGSGKSFQPGSTQKFLEDTTLYAVWEPLEVAYTVEHYRQDLEGEGYTLAEEDTQTLLALAGTTVSAQPKTYVGFAENTGHALRRSTGKVEADGSLVLKLFYDRDVYHVGFHLNGGEGDAPRSQFVRYGGYLQRPDDPRRAGYNFKGWCLDETGESSWDFTKGVEENTDTREVTLYAKWKDETAPVLREASFGEGYKDFLHWLVDRKDMAVTVPILEEGSGVERAEYMLLPVGGTQGEETPKAGGLPLGDYAVSGQDSALDGMDAGGRVEQAKVRKEDGMFTAEFTVSKDFIGKIAMVCTDRAGNVSSVKVLTAEDGGIILEDHAPEIQFTLAGQESGSSRASIAVQVSDYKNGLVSGGIAGVSYQADHEEKITLPEEEFQEKITEEYSFIVNFQGEGTHTLKVWAEDNAGNRSSKKTEVVVALGQPAALAKPAPLPGQSASGGEPQTGERTHVEIYATASMVAGFTYLLLYFKAKGHGMTEEKKEELVSRLVAWAKGAGGFKRALALAAVFLLLAYYHSIGKNVPEDWKEAQGQ